MKVTAGMNVETRSLHPLLRPLQPEDVDAVVGIETACFPFPWSRDIFVECLQAGFACFALQLGSELVGYSVQNWAAGESHLLNLCIHPRHRKRGLGSLVLEHAISHARALNCHVMFLEVRPSNRDASHLYQRRGFKLAGKRPAYYQAEHGREDALLMRLDLLHP